VLTRYVLQFTFKTDNADMPDHQGSARQIRRGPSHRCESYPICHTSPELTNRPLSPSLVSEVWLLVPLLLVYDPSVNSVRILDVRLAGKHG
jgi:hypothetical protein